MRIHPNDRDLPHMGFALKKGGFRVLTKLQKRTEQLTLEVTRILIGWKKALQQGDKEHSQQIEADIFRSGPKQRTSAGGWNCYLNWPQRIKVRCLRLNNGNIKMALAKCPPIGGHFAWSASFPDMNICAAYRGNVGRDVRQISGTVSRF